MEMSERILHWLHANGYQWVCCCSVERIPWAQATYIRCMMPCRKPEGKHSWKTIQNISMGASAQNPPFEIHPFPQSRRFVKRGICHLGRRRYTRRPIINIMRNYYPSTGAVFRKLNENQIVERNSAVSNSVSFGFSTISFDYRQLWYCGVHIFPLNCLSGLSRCVVVTEVDDKFFVVFISWKFE